MRTFTSTGTFVVLDCPTPGCGVAYAITRRLFDIVSNDPRRHVYCPNGHWVYWPGDTPEKRAEKAEARATALQDQLEASEREAERQRASLVRARERWAAGMCPCCRRSFASLAEHVRKQHPDFDAASIEGEGFHCSCGRGFATARGLSAHQGHVRPSGWENPKMPKWRRHLTVVGS